MPRISERDVPVILNRFDRRISDAERRIRALEDSVKGLESNLDALSEETFEKDKSVKKSLDEIRRNIKESIEKRVSDLEMQIKELAKILNMKIDKSELVVLKETLEMYDPIKSQFVTRGEVERMLSEKRSRL
ncbi:MAG: hypothetical protein HY512_02770 [Candidatus Aenigmarchaeota archaeon]|nr:hypothetical protein [Candidatus Aenigmarchaeota archaeon]